MVKIIYKKEIPGIIGDEKEFIDNALNQFGELAEKKLKEELSIEVYVKNYGKTKTNEYEVSLRLSCSGSKSCSKYFFESNATERDFSKAVNSAIEKMNTEIEHKLHVSDRRKK
jgi:hypothetical protein